jgi:plasmid stabilization system protein ParE
MKARFTIEALRHIAAIHSYIETRSPIAAAHIEARIFADADRLADFPYIGHVGVVPRTYEWIVQGLPYIIVHEIDERNEEIIVLGIFHGAQQR